VVYARVTRAGGDVEPQLSCEAPPGVGGPKKDWTTGESAFGELVGGCVFPAPRAQCRRLAAARSPLLEALGRAFPLEVAVGLNGRVWAAAGEASHVVLVGAALRACEGADPDEAAALAVVKKLCRASGLPAPLHKFAAGAGGGTKRRKDEASADAGDAMDEQDDAVVELSRERSGLGAPGSGAAAASPAAPSAESA